ncbi:hypothetical protein R3X27_02455 [Tropicimonas sp. TH_r6]|uniref:hypothetical protein n=1 Tax=Tropicimonas sp. TH_r6 TaxID=3082085 RepID=UPI00295426F5|nr:hypothetical protein [Tropicimonas sp. TH_r6]MDV7141536.1 hypothetical protein [Tropicimonas sp. TH_r6]
MICSIEDKAFQRLTTFANAAALDHRQWRWFLRELSEASGGIRVHLLVHDSEKDTALGHMEHGYDPVFVDSFDAYYGKRNAWAPAYLHAAPGKAVRAEELIPDARLEQTEFYNDWVRPQEDIIGRGFSVLNHTASRLTLVGGNIRRKDRDQLEQPFVDLLQKLSPLLQNALAISHVLGNISIENKILREGMEPDITALFALDRQCRIHYANRQGQRMIDRGDVVQQDMNSRLRFRDNRALAALARSVQDLNQPEITFGLPFFARNSERGQFLCRTIPVGETEEHLPWLAASGTSVAGFVLLLMSPVSPVQVSHRREARID